MHKDIATSIARYVISIEIEINWDRDVAYRVFGLNSNSHAGTFTLYKHHTIVVCKHWPSMALSHDCGPMYNYVYSIVVSRCDTDNN